MKILGAPSLSCINLAVGVLTVVSDDDDVQAQLAAALFKYAVLSELRLALCAKLPNEDGYTALVFSFPSSEQVQPSQLLYFLINRI